MFASTYLNIKNQGKNIFKNISLDFNNIYYILYIIAKLNNSLFYYHIIIMFTIIIRITITITI